MRNFLVRLLLLSNICAFASELQSQVSGTSEIIRYSEAIYAELVHGGIEARNFINSLDPETADLIARFELIDASVDQTMNFEEPRESTLDHQPRRSVGGVGESPSLQAVLSQDINYYVRVAISKEGRLPHKQLFILFNKFKNITAIVKVGRNGYSVFRMLPSTIPLQLEPLTESDLLVRLTREGVTQTDVELFDQAVRLSGTSMRVLSICESLLVDKKAETR